ncbi:MAG TPA: spermidine/putrescine ABC transporter substrate-binding protein [Solirubrobacterales bacterium]|nr:spermidine/putrescine ABC transporter substrate-binding protein [Solirubrobacterales bacterium]
MRGNTRLRALMLALAALAATLVLAACGGGDDVGGASGNAAETAEPGPVEGEFNFSNWVGYIDKGDGGTVAEFEAKHPGVTMNYNEDVNDNADFFGKMSPLLDGGESGGRSMFVVTDWMAKQMNDLGYLQAIDYADVPNVDANLKQNLRSPEFDPDRSFSIPWQSGMTGLLVNEKLAPDVRSVNDLFDPQYKGKVTVLTEMRDTVPLMLKADGIDPADATKQDWLDEIDKLDQAVQSGQLRRFTGNDYIQDMTNENTVAVIGWSGDIELIDNEDVTWRMPTDGCILWSDNMVIPVGAPNTAAALAWADFVYDPKVQADISDYVRYVSPVQGIEAVNPQLAQDELVNPPEEFTANCSTQPDPPGSAEDVQEVTEAFQAVITQ